MHNTVTFILNGVKTVYTGSMSARLLDVLRFEYKLTGTKCGCREGECGACSVIIDGRLYNSCLIAMGSTEGKEIITIEGYRNTGRFSVISEAFASVSAVQCGFCIPAMVLAAECLLAGNPKPSEGEIREAISGNICRCTGYNAIVKAIGIAADKLSPAAGIQTGPEFSVQLPAGNELCVAEPQTDGMSSVIPSDLPEALSLLSSGGFVPYCGGTDIMVDEHNDDIKFLYIAGLRELKQIYTDEKYIRFGAACTFSDAIVSGLTPAVLRDMCRQVASPAIRNAGTLGGNIANASAKADAALIFMVTDSLLRIQNHTGERFVPIRDFYTGGGNTVLLPDELITEILMPKHGIDRFYIKKVGARNALAISRISFAGIADIQDNVIYNWAAAFGAVTDIIVCCRHIDEMLIGKSIDEAKLLRDEYLSAYGKAIKPRRGRVGIAYRKDVCMNLLQDFLTVNGI